MDDPVILERDPLALDDPVVTEENLYCCQICNLQLMGLSHYSEKEKADIIKAGRPQPTLESLTVTSKRCTRRFNPQSYQCYEWLTGCERRSKVFCWACLLFSDKSSQWRSSGLSDLNNLHCAMKRHASCQGHIEAFLKLKTFGKIGQNVGKSHSIETVNMNKEEQVFINREIMKNLIRMVCFLGNHPSRSLEDFDHADPIGRNKFLDFFDFMTEFDDTLKRSVNNKMLFLGPDVRNNLIASTSNMLFERIKEEIRSSHFLSIMLDEVADLGETILISVIVRFITGKAVSERFFGFHEVPSSRLAEPLLDVLTGVVSSTDSALKVVSYSYDGGVVLTDYLPQFQSKVDELCPNALNLHFIEHQLSYILAQSLSSIKECKHFFSSINNLSSIFFKSKKLREELNLLLHRRKPNISDFDWTVNGSLIKNVLKIRQELIELFEYISRSEGEWDFETVFFTAGYLNTLKIDISFNLLLLLLSEVFVLADDLSDVLKVTVDDVTVCSQKVKEFIDFLQIKRDSFYPLYQDTICLLSDGVPPLKMIKLEENAFESLIRSTDTFKILYESVLWNMISHLNCRFRDLPKLQFMSFKLLKLIKKGKGVSVDGLSNFLPSFFAMPTLSTELNVLAKYQPINESNPKTLLKYLRYMDLESTFPQIVNFCEMILTLPVWKSAAVFNSIKSYIKRSSITHQLSNLAILSIERELVGKLLRQSKFYDEVIAEFIKKEPAVPIALTV